MTNVYEEKVHAAPAKEGYDEAAWSRLKHKIVAGVRGNHEYRQVKETSTDVMEDIFSKLWIEDAYADDAGFIKISLGEKKRLQEWQR